MGFTFECFLFLEEGEGGEGVGSVGVGGEEGGGSCCEVH